MENNYNEANDIIREATMNFNQGNLAESIGLINKALDKHFNPDWYAKKVNYLSRKGYFNKALSEIEVFPKDHYDSIIERYKYEIFINGSKSSVYHREKGYEKESAIHYNLCQIYLILINLYRGEFNMMEYYLSNEFMQEILDSNLKPMVNEFLLWLKDTYDEVQLEIKKEKQVKAKNERTHNFNSSREFDRYIRVKNDTLNSLFCRIDDQVRILEFDMLKILDN